jgi:hypothetical protein
MNSVERLDDLITRLERAAEQLRSGELSQAASELEQLTRVEAAPPAPGQDPLL